MYEINVSKNGHHYFATDERSLSSKQKALEMVQHFRSIFPESEGYKVELSELIRASKKIKTDDL